MVYPSPRQVGVEAGPVSGGARGDGRAGDGGVHVGTPVETAAGLETSRSDLAYPLHEGKKAIEIDLATIAAVLPSTIFSSGSIERSGAFAEAPSVMRTMRGRAARGVMSQGPTVHVRDLFSTVSQPNRFAKVS
jgi:hypothetical protein